MNTTIHSTAARFIILARKQMPGVRGTSVLALAGTAILSLAAATPAAHAQNLAPDRNQTAAVMQLPEWEDFSGQGRRSS